MTNFSNSELLNKISDNIFRLIHADVNNTKSVFFNFKTNEDTGDISVNFGSIDNNDEIDEYVNYYRAHPAVEIQR